MTATRATIRREDDCGCGSERAARIHLPAAECTDCHAPSEHHPYQAEPEPDLDWDGGPVDGTEEWR